MALTSLPNAGQTLVQTRDPIRINFDTINSGFALNHVELTAGDPNSGKHKFITFPLQVASPVFAGNDFGLWLEAWSGAGTSNRNELFLQNPQLPIAALPIRITASNLATAVTVGLPSVVSQAGWFYLPCGFLVKFGQLGVINANISSLAMQMPLTDASGADIPAFTTIIMGAMAISSNAGTVNSMISCSGPASGGQKLTHLFVSNAGTQPTSVFFLAIGY